MTTVDRIPPSEYVAAGVNCGVINKEGEVRPCASGHCWHCWRATFAAAVAAGLGSSAAFAGEVTGNCNNAKEGSRAADNCKDGQNANANSICSFSGQNDNPDSTNPMNPGGKTQSYGQDVKSGAANPSAENKSNQPVPEAFPHTGAACNGHSGFQSGP